MDTRAAGILTWRRKDRVVNTRSGIWGFAVLPKELVDLLAVRFGYESLLSIGCATAKGQPQHDFAPGYAIAEQIEYDPDAGDAGLGQFVERVRHAQRFDIVVADSCPTCAPRDLLFGLNLLTPRGTMVVMHRLDLFEAFVDFTIARKAVSHVTVDGEPRFSLIARNYRFNTFYAGSTQPHAEVDWFLHQQSHDPSLRDDDRHALLRMISLERFTALMDDFEVFSS